MIAFLAIVAGLTAVALCASAMTKATAVRPFDKTPVGPWGLLTRTSDQRRSLSAEERRWQTLLLKAEDDQGTWRAVGDRLTQLENTLGGEPPAGSSINFDRSELRATIARLEALTEGRSETP